MPSAWLKLRVALIILVVLVVGCRGGEDGDRALRTPATTEGATRPSADPDASTVHVILTEWAVEPGVATVAPGWVTFNISNESWVPHEFLVIRTDLAADALPVALSKADESQLAVVGRVGQFYGQEPKRITLKLDGGGYVLICNSLAHYQLGVRTAFRVGPPTGSSSGSRWANLIPLRGPRLACPSTQTVTLALLSRLMRDWVGRSPGYGFAGAVKGGSPAPLITYFVPTPRRHPTCVCSSTRPCPTSGISIANSPPLRITGSGCPARVISPPQVGRPCASCLRPSDAAASNARPSFRITAGPS